MSRAAAGLCRALLARAGDDRDRILLTDIQSTDWQSLTFTGERHVMNLRMTGPSPLDTARRVTDRLAEAEFGIAGHFVADIAARPLVVSETGSVLVVIEALTIQE